VRITEQSKEGGHKMDWILSHWDRLLEAVAFIISGASIIAKMTPTEVDDNLLGKFIIFMDKLGMNNQPTVKKAGR